MLSPKQTLTLLKQAGADFLEDKAPKLSAALAYYTAFAFAPMLVLGVMALGTVMGGDRDRAEQQVQNQLVQLMGPSGGQAATQLLEQASQQPKGWALAINIALLIFAAGGVFGELQDSLNTIWEVKPKPNAGWMSMIRQRFFSMAMVVGVVFLLLVSLIVSTVLAAISQRVLGDVKIVGVVLNTLLSVAVTTVLFAGIFKLLPDVKLSWGDVFHGAVLTAVLFEVGKWGLTVYLTRGSTASAFGAAGSLAALLVWVYYSGWILFFGAEFTQAYVAAHGTHKVVPENYAEPVTAEARAQMGVTLQKPTLAATRGDDRGGLKPPYRQPVPNRKVVTIEQPAQMNRQGYLLAAGGLAAGVIVGAAGVLTGRRWGEPRLTAIKINQRLEAIERRLGNRPLKQFGKELAIVERMAQIEQNITDATRTFKRKVNPPWYLKLLEPRKHQPAEPMGVYSRIKEYVS